jgi:hypothetical protein
MTTNAIKLGLSRYEIKSTYDNCVVVITAKNPEQAWSKFVTQKFGSLKPHRKEWAISKKD